MKINKIKKKGGIYKIYLDDKVINTYDEVILKYNLLYKQTLDEDLISKIEEENKFYENYNKALRLISTRLRSEYEVITYLNRQGCEDSIKIVDKLKKKGLINDYNFAKAYVSDKVNLSLDGPDKIKKGLEKLKVSEDIISEVISSIDEEIVISHIKKLIDKKIKNSKYTGNVLKNKLTIYLINLGYSRFLINKVLENTSFNHNIANEMEKAYKKLSLKYKDKELNLKLRQKLYAKGFTSDEINSFIETKGI